MHIRAREDPKNAEVRKERAERERGFQGRREGREGGRVDFTYFC